LGKFLADFKVCETRVSCHYHYIHRHTNSLLDGYTSLCAVAVGLPIHIYTDVMLFERLKGYG